MSDRLGLIRMRSGPSSLLQGYGADVGRGAVRLICESTPIRNMFKFGDRYLPIRRAISYSTFLRRPKTRPTQINAGRDARVENHSRVMGLNCAVRTATLKARRYSNPL